MSTVKYIMEACWNSSYLLRYNINWFDNKVRHSLSKFVQLTKWLSTSQNSREFGCLAVTWCLFFQRQGVAYAWFTATWFQNRVTWFRLLWKLSSLALGHCTWTQFFCTWTGRRCTLTQHTCTWTQNCCTWTSFGSTKQNQVKQSQVHWQNFAVCVMSRETSMHAAFWCVLVCVGFNPHWYKMHLGRFSLDLFFRFNSRSIYFP